MANADQLVGIGNAPQAAEQTETSAPGVTSGIPSNGGPQPVHVPEKALKRIRIAMAKEKVDPQQGGLRLGVQGGGCSGLSYNIRFDSQPRECDKVFEFDGVRLFVDPKSFLYLSGMTLDYEETLMRQGF